MGRYFNKILIRPGYLIFFFALNAYTIYGEPPIVSISNGTLEGRIMYSRLETQIYAYEGIPYATPPVGDLRFKLPQPSSAWKGKRQSIVPQLCVQTDVFMDKRDIMGEEDCLYLNVYTPSIMRAPLVSSYPVMVWFHGGGWISGAGHYFQPDYLLDHEVILVTVNYRLGPLGFLSTEDLECPGNLGLKDQQQALRWVRENIFAFHGDPFNVTIFGESSGGASVHYHMISPFSKGLFHRAISQSGTFYSPWALTSPGFAKEKAKNLALHLNCTTENSKKLIECLRTKSAKDIVAAIYIFQSFSYYPLVPFRPVIEPKHSDAFMIEDPLISVRENRIADVPWITGINSEEGTMIVPIIYSRKMVRKLNDEFMKIAPLTLLYQERYQLTDQLNNQEFVDEITNRIRDYYFGKNEIDETDKARFNVINMYGDAWFNHGTYTAVKDFIDHQTSPLYYYYFAYKGKTSFSSVFDSTKNYGVSHADELQYLFPVTRDLFTDEFSENNEKMIDLLTTLWSNFAKFGDPSPKITELIREKWTPLERNHILKYLAIVDTHNVSLKNGLLTDRMLFWDNLENRMQSVGKLYRIL